MLESLTVNSERRHHLLYRQHLPTVTAPFLPRQTRNPDTQRPIPLPRPPTLDNRSAHHPQPSMDLACNRPATRFRNRWRGILKARHIHHWFLAR